MNIGSIFSKIAGNNTGMIPMLYECFQIARGMDQSKGALLEYINKHNARIRDMLPYLQQGTFVRSILDSQFPGMAQKIEIVGKELMQEQESLQSAFTQQQSSPAAPFQQLKARNRFLPLKQRK